MMNRARITHSVRVLVATLVGVLLAAPLFYMALNSLMPDSQTADLTPQLIPNSVHFSNYTAALSGTTQVIYSRSFLNSVIFTFFVVLLQWMLCISGGLAISKMRFRSRTVITVLLGVSLFIPILTTLIPTFIVTLKLGLINTYPGVILPIVAQTGFGTLLFRQYISQMPEELFDAARIDGANWWTMLRRLVIPLAKPATGAYVAISVLTAWNMYLWPLVAAPRRTSRCSRRRWRRSVNDIRGHPSAEHRLCRDRDRHAADDRRLPLRPARVHQGPDGVGRRVRAPRRDSATLGGDGRG
jgi:multiple sugar transport system permease protein